MIFVRNITSVIYLTKQPEAWPVGRVKSRQSRQSRQASQLTTDQQLNQQNDNMQRQNICMYITVYVKKLKNMYLYVCLKHNSKHSAIEYNRVTYAYLHIYNDTHVHRYIDDTCIYMPNYVYICILLQIQTSKNLTHMYIHA